MTSAILPSREDRGDFSNPMFFSRTETKDLESARVGYQWAFPAHESMESPHLLDQIFPWLEVEMEGIGDDHLAVDLKKILHRNGIHCSQRADSNE